MLLYQLGKSNKCHCRVHLHLIPVSWVIIMSKHTLFQQDKQRSAKQARASPSIRCNRMTNTFHQS